MLRHLDIRDMLLIDRLELEFRPGLNVLTGETGAGKSILLDCLGFVLGWRGRADLVRSGATQGEVTAAFDLPADHPGRVVLTEAGIPVSDELLLRRVNAADGRKTAWINDRRASGEVLRRDVAISSYVPDRSPTVRFPGRAYVLPASGDLGLTMSTINADEVELTLYRMSDRNLVAALRDDLVHVAEVLSAAEDASAIDYIARFLAGVARSARDQPLEDAATALARDHSAGRALAADLARISGLVQDRLAATGTI